jgi:uncharacterized protein YdhG (YjbR/CyaY superfamily)
MNSVDNYISQFPTHVQDILNHIRFIILQTAPEAEESIAYQIPAYKYLGKPLVYFAAYKNHIGLYATPTGHSEFEQTFSKYKQGKGSVQFPLSEEIPYDLIQEIVAFNMKEIKKEKKPLKFQRLYNSNYLLGCGVRRK